MAVGLFKAFDVLMGIVGLENFHGDEIQNTEFSNLIGHGTLIRQVCEPPAFELPGIKMAFALLFLPSISQEIPL